KETLECRGPRTWGPRLLSVRNLPNQGIRTVQEIFYRRLRVESLEERRFLSTTPSLQVVSLAPTPTGFVIQLNRDVDTRVLSAFDQVGTLGPADVTLSGASTGAVRGSLVVDVLARKFTFIRTGGPLSPDAYTVNLRSGATGWVDTTGNVLDG